MLLSGIRVRSCRCQCLIGAREASRNDSPHNLLKAMQHVCSQKLMFGTCKTVQQVECSMSVCSPALTCEEVICSGIEPSMPVRKSRSSEPRAGLSASSPMASPLRKAT